MRKFGQHVGPAGERLGNLSIVSRTDSRCNDCPGSHWLTAVLEDKGELGTAGKEELRGWSDGTAGIYFFAE